jgi:hypothetical protein
MREALFTPLYTDRQESELLLFSLDRLLPVGQRLSVNTHCLVISLVSTTAVNGNPILLQSRLTEQQLRVLLPLLKWPGSCFHELLLASLFCSWRQLLAGLFPMLGTAGGEWLAVVQETAELLERAQEQGTLRKELKPLYNELSELRAKLRPFGLGIAICTSRAAYALFALPASLEEEASCHQAARAHISLGGGRKSRRVM